MSELVKANEIELKTMADVSHLAKSISLSVFAGSMKRQEDILCCILLGRELGFAPMQSTRTIHVISGKPTLSADAMAALCMQSPTCKYFMLVELTEKRAEYETLRNGHPKPTRMTYTIDDAKTAGLLSNSSWSKYVKDMLKARCIARLARAVYPDVTLGLYAPEELADEPTIQAATQASASPASQHVEEAAFVEAPRQSPPVPQNGNSAVAEAKRQAELKAYIMSELSKEFGASKLEETRAEYWSFLKSTSSDWQDKDALAKFIAFKNACNNTLTVERAGQEG